MSQRTQLLTLAIIGYAAYRVDKKTPFIKNLFSGTFTPPRENDTDYGTPNNAVRQDIHGHKEPRDTSMCKDIARAHHPWGVKRQKAINKCKRLLDGGALDGAYGVDWYYDL